VCHGFRLTKRDEHFRVNLTFLNLSFAFLGRWGSSLNLLESKIKPALANLAYPNP